MRFFAPKIEIKQSKRPKKSNNQSHFAIPLSHPTPKINQNNQNPGIIPVNIPHWARSRAVKEGAQSEDEELAKEVERLHTARAHRSRMPEESCVAELDVARG